MTEVALGDLITRLTSALDAAERVARAGVESSQWSIDIHADPFPTEWPFVLRQVEGARKLLELHQLEDAPISGMSCSVCDEIGYTADWPCASLTILAAAWGVE